jgi:sterol 3beta-glucosyltransferase
VKILISTFGTRGDVQPYLALAVGLRNAGHAVTLCTSYNYTEWIESYGVNTHPTRFSIQEHSQKPEIQAIIRGGNFIRQIQTLRDAIRQNAEAQDEVWAAIQNTEFVIQSPAGNGALEATSQLGIPSVFASPVPFAPTRAFPSFFLGGLRASLGAGYNALTHKLMHRMLWSVMGGPMSGRFRKNLGLRAWRSYDELLANAHRQGTPWLYGFSTHVIPKPVDWDEYQHITGYWFLDAPSGWQPPEDLVRFIESGLPPVYVGFGSMNHENPERQTRMALRALELSGQRGVLLTGWGGIRREDAPPTVFFTDSVPHDWLFPRMAAVIHHGGAGTTSAGLRAGVPNIITPFANNDQGSWADYVVKLGIGPRVPAIQQLTAEKLANAIQAAVMDTALRARATTLGGKIRAEDGLARATEIIERQAATWPTRKPNFLER